MTNPTNKRPPTFESEIKNAREVAGELLIMLGNRIQDNDDPYYVNVLLQQASDQIVWLVRALIDGSEQVLKLRNGATR